MTAIKKLSKRRALSPVIATVILVAVAITVAVGVSYWMSGIAGQYTAFEKVEIQSAECTFTPADTTDNGYWGIVIDLKNSGTKTATLTDIFVNDKKADLTLAAPTGLTSTGTYASFRTTGTADDPLPIDSGATGIVTVYIISGETLTSGTTVNIKIHSAGGMDYIKLLQLT